MRLVASLLCLLFARTAEAAADPVAPAAAPEPPVHVILADLGLHVIGVGYQRTIKPTLAAQLDLESYTPWTHNIDLFGLAGPGYTGDVSGLALRARVFVYPFGRAPTGLWVSPFAQGGVGRATVAGEKRVGPVWAAGASVGGAWLLGRHVHVALGLGGQYHAGHFAGSAGPPSFGGLYPQLDASLGWAFGARAPALARHHPPPGPP